MPRTRHGGKRTPSKPAPVSGPGALSKRTDGGPGSMKVTGLPYGQNKQVNEQAAAGNAAAASAASPSSASGGGGGAGRPVSAMTQGPAGVFSPTARPGEPLTAGVDMGAGPGRQPQMTQDPMLLLRVIHDIHPTPHMARLIARLEGA